MKGYQCSHLSCAMDELDKSQLRETYQRKKQFTTTLFGLEQRANLCMLIGEVNVLADFGVFTDYQAEQERRQLMNFIGIF